MEYGAKLNGPLAGWEWELVLSAADAGATSVSPEQHEDLDRALDRLEAWLKKEHR